MIQFYIRILWVVPVYAGQRYDLRHAGLFHALHGPNSPVSVDACSFPRSWLALRFYQDRVYFAILRGTCCQ